METQQVQNVAPQQNLREMNAQEMMFVIASYFYIHAADAGYEALMQRNPAFVVIKNSSSPETQQELANTSAERQEITTETENDTITPVSSEKQDEDAAKVVPLAQGTATSSTTPNITPVP